ncbi:hypothetical protein AGQ53_26270 [Salmonella enterica subsp. enterica]|nr:hypothetical protein AGQ53_26270 [Salmonella enterica subsp. enterica]
MLFFFKDRRQITSFIHIWGDERGVKKRDIQFRRGRSGLENKIAFSRICFTRHVDDIVVLKAANHVTDSFGFTDIGQEVVIQPFAFECAFDQTGDTLCLLYTSDAADE